MTAMLNYFDEEPQMLFDCVKSVCDVGVDHVIALDGPYANFPHEKTYSLPSSNLAIVEACRESGVDWWVVTRNIAWEGDEVAKRNEMLRLALSPILDSWFEPRPPLAGPDDWLLVVDADHRWSVVDGYSLKVFLAASREDFAEVAFADARHPDGSWAWYEARLLNRAITGMRYDGAHWRISLPDGRTSSTLRAGGSTSSALDLRGCVQVTHHLAERDPERLAKQAAWYHERDTRGLEK